MYGCHDLRRRSFSFFKKKAIDIHRRVIKQTAFRTTSKSIFTRFDGHENYDGRRVFPKSYFARYKTITTFNFCLLTVLLARFFTLQLRYAVFPKGAVTFFDAALSKYGRSGFPENSPRLF